MESKKKKSTVKKVNKKVDTKKEKQVKKTDVKKTNVKKVDVKKVEAKKVEQKKEKQVKKDKSNRFSIIKYLKEVKQEATKVRWPDRKEMVKYATATIVFILFFALFFLGVDTLITLLKDLKKLVG